MNVLNKGYIPSGSTTFVLTKDVYCVDMFSYYEIGMLEYGNPNNGGISYENASEIDYENASEKNPGTFSANIIETYGTADYLVSDRMPLAKNDYYELEVRGWSSDDTFYENTTNLKETNIRISKNAKVFYKAWDTTGQEVYTEMTLDEYARKCGFESFLKMEYIRIMLDNYLKMDKE